MENVMTKLSHQNVMYWERWKKHVFVELVMVDFVKEINFVLLKMIILLRMQTVGINQWIANNQELKLLQMFANVVQKFVVGENTVMTISVYLIQNQFILIVMVLEKLKKNVNV